jgi:hypothetical protein
VNAAGLLCELQVRGFIPVEGGERFDLMIRDGVLCVPQGLVRVALDDNVVAIYVMTASGVLLWDARLSDRVPVGVVTGVVDGAIAHVVTAAADADAIGLAWG